MFCVDASTILSTLPPYAGEGLPVHAIHIGDVSPWVAENFSWYYQPQPEGREHLSWVVCYRDEEFDEFEGRAFGTGETFWLALADLLIRYRREVWA